jgi:hypothetical protein
MRRHELEHLIVDVMLQHKIVNGATVQERIGLLPISPEQKNRLHAWVGARMSDDK